jgi:hypothetical protein
VSRDIPPLIDYVSPLAILFGTPVVVAFLRVRALVLDSVEIHRCNAGRYFALTLPHRDDTPIGVGASVVAQHPLGVTTHNGSRLKHILRCVDQVPECCTGVAVAGNTNPA